MKLILEGILENIATRNDGSIKITFGTNEMDPSQAGNLFQMRNKYMKCLLSDTNVSSMEQDLVDLTEIVDGKRRKTQSQRLRGVMFKVFEQKGLPGDFDPWYKSEMEKIIDGYKAVLNDDT